MQWKLGGNKSSDGTALGFWHLIAHGLAALAQSPAAWVEHVCIQEVGVLENIAVWNVFQSWMSVMSLMTLPFKFRMQPWDCLCRTKLFTRARAAGQALFWVLSVSETDGQQNWANSCDAGRDKGIWKLGSCYMTPSGHRVLYSRPSLLYNTEGWNILCYEQVLYNTCYEQVSYNML